MDAAVIAMNANIISLLGYIDPGTGSLVFQVVAASLVSAGLFFKGWRAKAAWMMGKVFGAKNSSEAAQCDEQPEVSRKAA